MNNLFGTVYADLRRQLQKYIETVTWPSPEAGFLRYLLSEDAPSNYDYVAVSHRLSEAPILASTGYLYCTQAMSLTGDFMEDWSRAFDRLLQRNPFPSDRESYFYRPLELLGICLGAKHCLGVVENSKEALRKILQDGRVRIDEGDFWNYSLSSFGAWQLGIAWKRKALPLPQHLSFEELCLLYWLLRQKDFGKNTDLDCPTEVLQERILRLSFTHCIASTTPSRAGVALVVSEDLVDTRISSALQQTWPAQANTVAAEEIVGNLARRFHTFANQLAQRHDNRRTIKIRDEYDVQDVLHAVLRLHFEDVRAEEWAPSHAGYSTRMDFLLKRQRIVIEAKMTRQGLDQKGVVKELAEDIERYRSHPDFKTLICVVYDPDSRCKNSAALEADLSGMRGSLKVVVHVVPKS